MNSPAQGTPPDQIAAVSGDALRPDDLPDVSSVFGSPYEAQGKTLIPIAAVQRVVLGNSESSRWSGAKAKAVIEVGDGHVRVVDIPDPLQIILPGMIVGAWHVYWILKTIRALRGKS